MPLYKCEGFVIRTFDLGESDRVVTLFTRGLGKKRAVAHGARKTKSKISGSTLLFTHGEYVIYTGRSLDHISQAAVVTAYPALRGDYRKMAYASYASEMVDTFTEPDDPAPPIFGLLSNYFRLLSDTGTYGLLTRIYELELLGLLGFSPHLAGCVACGADPARARVGMSVERGGAVCEDCAEGVEVGTISGGAFQVMRRIQEMGFGVMRRLRPDENLLREIERFNREYIVHHLDTVLKSLSFLDAVK